MRSAATRDPAPGSSAGQSNACPWSIRGDGAMPGGSCPCLALDGARRHPHPRPGGGSSVLLGEAGPHVRHYHSPVRQARAAHGRPRGPPGWSAGGRCRWCAPTAGGALAGQPAMAWCRRGKRRASGVRDGRDWSSRSLTRRPPHGCRSWRRCRDSPFELCSWP